MDTSEFGVVAGLMREAVDKLSNNYSGSSLTDVFIVVDKESGEIFIYDDERNCISESIVSEWAESDEEISDSEVGTLLGDVVSQLDIDDDIFSSLDLYKPFSISYADSDFNVIEELLTITESTMIQLDDDLLEKFDKDFDEFLERLMKE